MHVKQLLITQKGKAITRGPSLRQILINFHTGTASCQAAQNWPTIWHPLFDKL